MSAWGMLYSVLSNKISKHEPLYEASKCKVSLTLPVIVKKKRRHYIWKKCIEKTTKFLVSKEEKIEVTLLLYTSDFS